MCAPNPERNNIRILLADDHALVRKGIAAVLGLQPHFIIVGEAANGVEAVEQAQRLQPDIILMDLVMPRMSGIEAITEIKHRNPEARILVLTSFDEDNKVFPAIKAGALGYLLKDSTPNELIKAIEDVSQGRPSLHPSIALKLLQDLKEPSGLPPTEEPLTVRELEVLVLLARGLSNQDIATSLSVSERTVSTHVCNILSKLHLANRTQAALYALRKGLADLNSGKPH